MAEFAHCFQKADHVIPTQHTSYLISNQDRQLVDTVPVHFSKGLRQFSIRSDPFHFLHRDHHLGGSCGESVFSRDGFDIMQCYQSKHLLSLFDNQTALTITENMLVDQRSRLADGKIAA